MIANHALVEDIRDSWSRRAETFDRAFGHAIAPGGAAAAWAAPMRDHLGPMPRRVLEFACGTGEVTRSSTRQEGSPNSAPRIGGTATLRPPRPAP